jgi:hypothetical protein
VDRTGTRGQPFRYLGRSDQFVHVDLPAHSGGGYAAIQIVALLHTIVDSATMADL